MDTQFNGTVHKIREEAVNTAFTTYMFHDVREDRALKAAETSDLFDQAVNHPDKSLARLQRVTGFNMTADEFSAATNAFREEIRRSYESAGLDSFRPHLQARVVLKRFLVEHIGNLIQDRDFAKVAQHLPEAAVHRVNRFCEGFTMNHESLLEALPHVTEDYLSTQHADVFASHKAQYQYELYQVRDSVLGNSLHQDAKVPDIAETSLQR